MRHDVRQLEKTIEYLKIQEILGSENLTHLVNISCFPRRRQRNNFLSSKTSSENVFKTSLRCICKMPSSRRFQEDVVQLCLEDVLKDRKMLHWRRLQDRKMLHGRRLQDVFKTSSVMFYQDECLLGSIIYAKQFFYMFFSALKEIIQVQSKRNHWIS